MNTLYLVICRWFRIISRVHRSKFKLHLMLKLTRHLMYSKCADRRLEVDLSAPSTDLPKSQQTNRPTDLSRHGIKGCIRKLLQHEAKLHFPLSTTNMFLKVMELLMAFSFKCSMSKVELSLLKIIPAFCLRRE